MVAGRGQGARAHEKAPPADDGALLQCVAESQWPVATGDSYAFAAAGMVAARWKAMAIKRSQPSSDTRWA